MSRLAFRLQPIPAASGSLVRIDTASGSNTPADLRTLGGNAIDGAIIRSGSNGGHLPVVLGPDGVTTLYQKTLDYRGQVTGTPVTLTGEDDNPSAPAGGAATTNASLLTSGTLSAARLPDLSGTYEAAGLSAATRAAVTTPYGLALGKGNCVVPISTHSGLYGNLQSNGTDTAVNYRVFVPLSDPTATTCLPVFANLPNFAVAGEQAPPNPITISAAVELSDGTVVPFFFNGQHTVTITSGLAIPDSPVNFGAQVTDSASYVSGLTGVFIRTQVTVAPSRVDTVGLTSASPTVTDTSILASDQGRRVTGTGIPANTYVGTVTAGTSFLLSSRPESQVNVNATATNASASATIASYIPLPYNAFANGNKANVTTNDLTLDTSTAGSSGFGGSNASCYGPAVVLGVTPKAGRKPIVAGITDSIFYGTTDQGVGPVARACAALGFGHVKLSKVSETAASYAAPVSRRYRMSLVPGCTHAVVELGTNDGVDTTAKATALQASLTTLINYLTGQGIKVYLTTVPPKGLSSTDGYATTAFQTPYNIAAGLAQINTWIRSSPLGVSGVIEMNDPLSSARDSGLWAQAPNGRHLTDLATTSGTNIVTSASANFTSADIGSCIYVTGVYTSAVAQIAAVTNSTTVTVNNVSNPASPTAFNAASTVTGVVGAVGSWYATSDGTHPATSMMTGPIRTAVQAALTGLTV